MRLGPFSGLSLLKLLPLAWDAFSSPRIPIGMQGEKGPSAFGNGCCHPLFVEGAVTVPQRSIRIPEATDAKLQSAARAGGLGSPTAFIRYAIDQELSGRRDNLVGVEERLAGNIEQMRRELFRLGRGQQALFAFVDSLAKILLTCLPEPPQDVREQAIARASERHNRLVKSAGTAMVGDSQAAMQDLVSRVEK